MVQMDKFLSTIEIDPLRGGCRIGDQLYPLMGFGTYPLKGKACEEGVGAAAALGYRIFDTATYYRNFPAIAQGLKNLKRTDYYLISKVWPTDLAPTDLRRDFEMTLQALQTDYLDAYLVHWPNSGIPIGPTLSAMHQLQQEGLLRHIGLSNVTAHHLRRALEKQIAINWVQIEMHPQFYDRELYAFCQAHKIHLQAWAPLGRGRLCEDPLLKKLGERHNKTPAQVALRWISSLGVLALPGSGNPRHMQENLEALSFSLSPQEIEQLSFRAKDGQRERYYFETLGFYDEFDFKYEECWPSG